jgi:hypothetical protein
MGSPAAATNSFFRLFSAFVFTEAAVPMQNSLGDGGLYSLWAVIVIICEVLILLVRARGERWRTDAEERAKVRSFFFFFLSLLWEGRVSIVAPWLTIEKMYRPSTGASSSSKAGPKKNKKKKLNG